MRNHCGAARSTRRKKHTLKQVPYLKAFYHLDQGLPCRWPTSGFRPSKQPRSVASGTRGYFSEIKRTRRRREHGVSSQPLGTRSQTLPHSNIPRQPCRYRSSAGVVPPHPSARGSIRTSVGHEIDWIGAEGRVIAKRSGSKATLWEGGV